MKRIKIMALAAIAAFAAFAVLAGSAFAAKAPLTLVDPAGPVPVGETITAVSHNLVTVTSAGNLECETNELPVKVSINGASKDKGVASSESSFGHFMEIPGACETSLGIPTEILTQQFPWNVEFKPKSGAIEVAVKGTKKVAFQSTFLYPPLGEENECGLEASKIVSTSPAGTPGHPVALAMTTTAQAFKWNKKQAHKAAICPETGSLSGTWTVEDKNGVVSSE